MPSKKIESALPHAKQKRGQETIESVLSVTARILAEHGEGKVRIQEIANETGVSIGSIYHHFGNREGLILAANVATFTKGFKRDLDALMSWLDSITTIEQLTDDTTTFRNLINKNLSDDLAGRRIAILGSIRGRPELKAALTEVQSKIMDRFSVSVERLQQLGIVKANVSPRAVALMAIGMTLGRAVAEIDSTPVDNEEWNQVALEMLSGLIPVDLLFKALG